MIVIAYPLLLIIGIPLIMISAWWRLNKRRTTTYQFPLIHLFLRSAAYKNQRMHYQRWVIFCLRITACVLLLIAAARPQKADERSYHDVEGIATMMVLDVSGSMECFDDMRDQATRFSIAQQEAIKFINRRGNDLFGVILFGAVAASRCPLTSDKKIVTELIRDTKLGFLNPAGTVLAVAIAMGVSRLRNAQAQSKIMVVLTDGEPSPEDIDPQKAIDLARNAGIKIYTIGIGSGEGGFIMHPLGGAMRVQTPLNKKLLASIARQTGGAFFEARNQKELEAIYVTIDSLEKSSHQAPIYTQYTELYWIVVILALVLMFVELCMTSIWRVIL